MILDTTYLLPLARIGVKTDLLKAIADARVTKPSLDEVKVSLISLFELQAKATKLGIPPHHTAKAVNAILKALPVIPFYRADVIARAQELYNVLRDYVDSVIVATAVVLGEDLVTEDTVIHRHRGLIEREHGIRILKYDDLVSPSFR